MAMDSFVSVWLRIANSSFSMTLKPWG